MHHRCVRGVGRVVADVAIVDVILQHVGNESGIVAGVSESSKGLREEKGERVPSDATPSCGLFRFGILTSLVGAKTVLLPAVQKAQRSAS